MCYLSRLSRRLHAVSRALLRPQRLVFLLLSTAITHLAFFDPTRHRLALIHNKNEALIHVSAFQKRPLVVALEGDGTSHTIRTREVEPVHSPSPSKKMNCATLDRTSYNTKKENEGCVPLNHWYNEHYPTCLMFHEIDLSESGRRRIAHGSVRDVWELHHYDGAKVAMKTVRTNIKCAFTENRFETHRIDALVMEKLSASPNVIDIYGHCYNSVLVEYAESTLQKIFRIRPKLRPLLLPSKDKLLRIAYNVADALADVHNFANGRATIAHNDLKPNQFLSVSGRYKLNDFNWAQFLWWDPQQKLYCGLAKGFNDRWTAPERANGDGLASDKADVYTLGYIFYFLLTGEVPFPAMEDGADFRALIASGARPVVRDEAILNSTHPFDTAMLRVMDMCLRSSPDERPDAREVANVLRKAVG